MSTFGERVRMAREEKEMSQEDLGNAIGIKQPSVAAMEKSKAKTNKHLIEIADALGQTTTWLRTGEGEFKRHRNAIRAGAGHARGSSTAVASGVAHRTIAPDMHISMRQVPVIGFVQAGVWLSTIELPPEDRFDIPLPIQAGFDGFVVQGLVVRGPSMDELYPHGSILAVVSFLDLGRDPRNGERVVALRHRHGESEATVKEYRIGKDGKERLWPRSSHPDFQQPILVDPPDGEDEELRIAYLVIGSYRPEI